MNIKQCCWLKCPSLLSIGWIGRNPCKSLSLSPKKVRQKGNTVAHFLSFKLTKLKAAHKRCTCFFFPCVSPEICIHLTVGLILNHFHLRVIFFILHKDVKSPNKGEHQKKHIGSDCVQKDSYTGTWASVRCTRPPAVLCLCKCPKMSDLDRLKRWGEKPSFSCTSHLLSGDWMISKTQGLLHRHTHTL